MPGTLIFLQPALLTGAAAAALPVLIHLLLRPRPRRTRFPTLSLMRGVVVSGQRASRLRNVALLVLRASMLMLIAALLAGPTWTDPTAEFGATEPLACVVIVDDSISMQYRAGDDRTRLDWAAAAALELVEQAANWPRQSALAVTSPGMDKPPIAVSEDRAAAAATIRDLVRAADHARGLDAALRVGAELLRAAPQRARRIVVFTDGCAHAWRDVTPGILAGIDHLCVHVVVPPEEPTSNLAIVEAAGPPWVPPATAAIPLQITLAAEGRDGDCWLVAREGGQTLSRRGPLRVAAGHPVEVELELPPLSAGMHAITLQIEPADRLTFDDVRYVVLQTRPPPLAWLVAPAEPPVDQDLSATIVMNLLAPAALPPQQQLVRLQAWTPHDVSSRLIAAEATAGEESPALVVVLPEARLAATELAGLLRLIELGTTVLLVPGSAAQAPDWPGLRELLSPSTPEAEFLASPTVIRWLSESPFNDEEGLEELTKCAVRRRLRLTELTTGTLVYARFSDDLPAILGQTRGAGRLVLLATAPDPGWSDLGIRAGGLLTWLHLLVARQQATREAVADIAAGTQTQQPLPGLSGSGLATVTYESKTPTQSWWVRLADGKPERPWPADQPGVYRVEAMGTETTARYVVNWPAEESRLAPLSPEALPRLLGIRNARLDFGVPAAGTRSVGLVGRLLTSGAARKVLAGMLLLAFVLELWLASRRRPAATPMTNG